MIAEGELIDGIGPKEMVKQTTQLMPHSLTCTNCSKSLPDTAYASNIINSKFNISVYDALQELFKHFNMDNHYFSYISPTPDLKFCFTCGRNFSRLFTHFRTFINLSLPEESSYYLNLFRKVPPPPQDNFKTNIKQDEINFSNFLAVSLDETTPSVKPTATSVTLKKKTSRSNNATTESTVKSKNIAQTKNDMTTVVRKRKRVLVFPPQTVLDEVVPSKRPSILPKLIRESRPNSQLTSSKNINIIPKISFEKQNLPIHEENQQKSRKENKNRRKQAFLKCDSGPEEPHFTSQEELTTHYHNDSSSIQCQLCDAKFGSDSLLGKHYRSIHPSFPHRKQGGRRLSDADRDLIFTREYKCDQETCPSISLPNYREWCDHHMEVHGTDMKNGNRDVPRQGLYRPCPQCGKAYNGNSTMLVHIKTQHLKERPFACDKCGKKFAAKKVCNTHIMQHVNKETGPPHLCAMCGATFTTSDGLIKHEQRHCGFPIPHKQPYVCETCGKKFRMPCLLKNHQWVHTKEPRPFPCDECDMSFATSGSLKFHKERHAKKKMNIVDQFCEVCGKGYAFRNELRVHLESVHKYDRIKAQVAAGLKRLSTFRILPNGEKVCDDELRKPKSCYICSKKYSRREGLFTHLIAVHGKTGDEAREITNLRSIRESQLIPKRLKANSKN